MSQPPEFDAYAADYDATVQSAIGASGETVQFFAELKARQMARALGGARPGSILDFGCGIGNSTRALGRCFTASAITGVDPSPESLAVARGLSGDMDRVRFVENPGATLPFGDESFDAAFTSGAFHHIDVGQRVCWAEEIRRVLRRGAPFFLFEHNPYNPLTLSVVRSVPFDRGVVLLRPRDARRVLAAAGFTVVSRPRYYFFFPSLLRALRGVEPLLSRVPLGAQYFIVSRRS